MKLDIKPRYMCMEIKYFYLKNKMDTAEYIMVWISMITQKNVVKYNLKVRAHNGYIFTWLTKGIYGLPQSGRIAHDALIKNLEPHGYRPLSKTPGLWSYYSRPINFTLLVNYFGVKYSVKEHTLHLKSAQQDKYKSNHRMRNKKFHFYITEM